MPLRMSTGGAVRLVAVRTGLAAILLALVWVVAGELLQGWVGLHLNAWHERHAFGGARDRLEWQRVNKALELGQFAFPWKTSLYLDIARVQLFGVQGGFVGAADAGEAVLVAMDTAALRRQPDGESLVLAIRGHLLVGDDTGARTAIAELKRVAPHTRRYWQPLAALLSARARQDPLLMPIAEDVSTHYRALHAARLTP